MLELGRRERHLLSGLGVQILVVGLLVFAYTQAMRQIKHRCQLQIRLQEQLAVAREQVARQGAGIPDLDGLQASLAKLQGAFISPEKLSEEVGRLKELAAVQHGFGDLQVKVGEMPVETLRLPVGGEKPDDLPAGSVLEVELYPVEITGHATSLSVAGFCARLGAPAFRPLLPLVGMDLKRSEPAGVRPVNLWLRYLIPVSSGSPAPAPVAPPATQAVPWGARTEPFLPGQD